jgi:hypothetical protein
MNRKILKLPQVPLYKRTFAATLAAGIVYETTG